MGVAREMPETRQRIDNAVVKKWNPILTDFAAGIAVVFRNAL